jgi:hypothetical protein
MWTLVIIVLTNGVGPSGGAASSMSALIFASEDQCREAAVEMSGSGYVGIDKGGPYQIIAKCFARSTTTGGLPGAKK